MTPVPSPPLIPEKADIVPQAIDHIARQRQLVDTILGSIEPSAASFDNVAKPLLELENQLRAQQAVISARKYCSPDPETQHQAEQAEALWEKDNPELHPELFQLFRAIRNRHPSLDREDQTYVDHKVLGFTSQGCGILDSSGIARYQARESRIATLCAEYHRTLRQQDGGQFLSPAELDGVPKSLWGDVNGEGRHYFSYATGYHAILSNAHQSETRQRIMEGYHGRGSENVTRFREIILLRDENARELGHESHAAAQLPFRSVESIAWVEVLIEQIGRVLIPCRRLGFEKLLAAKKRHLAESSSCSDAEVLFMPWDRFYYSKLLATEKKVDLSAVPEYFPLRHTFRKLLEIVADLFSLEFRPLQCGPGYLWHNSVHAWTVWQKDAEEEFVGHLFANLLSRPNKYKGNQSVNLQPGFVQADGRRSYPSNILMCNFHEKDPKTGCLLSHNNVITLFHELGHSMHDLLAQTKYARYHGYNVTREFAEFIATTFEHWCWIPDELLAISRHYPRTDPAYMQAWKADHAGVALPPETIPEDLLQLCLQRRGSHQIDVLADILLMSKYDLCVQQPRDNETLINLDARKLYQNLYEQVMCRPICEGSNQYLSGGLLFARYDAGYYAYLCAKVYAADIFQTAFAADPRSQESWDRFHKIILRPGGSRDELQMLRIFLGRTPDSRALCEMLEM